MTKGPVSSLILSVSTCPCIVTRPPPSINSSVTTALVNPANEQLVMTALPYFPMAGPPPKDLTNTNWGGAGVGSEMFYPIQTIDGLLNLHGGSELREACYKLPVFEDVELLGGGGNPSGGYGSVRCPVGSAVLTEAYGEKVQQNYDYVIHTVPPLWPGVGGSKLTENQATKLLQSCYLESIKTCLEHNISSVTMPLLGAGARRTPVYIAMNCLSVGIMSGLNYAQQNLTDRSPKCTPDFHVQIAVMEPWIAKTLVDLFEEIF